MNVIRSHTCKMPNIIPTLTGYELCKGGNINGGWKVVQRNPSCPKMGTGFRIISVGLDLGVPHRDNPNPIPIFLATMVPVKSQK